MAAARAHARVHDVIVVGGGTMGSAAAFYMAKDGLDVLVLEAERFGHEYVDSWCGVATVLWLLVRVVEAVPCL